MKEKKKKEKNGTRLETRKGMLWDVTKVIKGSFSCRVGSFSHYHLPPKVHMENYVS